MTTIQLQTRSFGTAASTTTLPRTSQLSATRPRTMPRLRMTARGRRLLLAVVVIPMLVVIAAFALNSGKAAASSNSVALTYVSVQQGESLWQLANSVAPTADPRDVIADIESLNHLDSSNISAGQRLAIPSRYLSASAGN